MEVWHCRGSQPLRKDLENMCKGYLCIRHILASGHARFHVADDYTTPQPSDALMVEIDGVGISE